MKLWVCVDIRFDVSPVVFGRRSPAVRLPHQPHPIEASGGVGGRAKVEIAGDGADGVAASFNWPIPYFLDASFRLLTNGSTGFLSAEAVTPVFP